jgi:hypothetical protein
MGETGSRPTGSFFVADDRSSRSRSPPISSSLGRIPLAPRCPSPVTPSPSQGIVRSGSSRLGSSLPPLVPSLLHASRVSSAAPSYRDHVRSLHLSLVSVSALFAPRLSER